VDLFTPPLCVDRILCALAETAVVSVVSSPEILNVGMTPGMALWKLGFSVLLNDSVPNLEALWEEVQEVA
jgi:hypothetical protein